MRLGRVSRLCTLSLAALAGTGCRDVTQPLPRQPVAHPPLESGTSDEGPTRCEGSLRGTFEHVYVPPGASCALTRSVVHGNVVALDASRLDVGDSQIGGDVVGAGILRLQL